MNTEFIDEECLPDICVGGKRPTHKILKDKKGYYVKVGRRKIYLPNPKSKIQKSKKSKKSKNPKIQKIENLKVDSFRPAVQLDRDINEKAKLIQRQLDIDRAGYQALNAKLQERIEADKTELLKINAKLQNDLKIQEQERLQDIEKKSKSKDAKIDKMQNELIDLDPDNTELYLAMTNPTSIKAEYRKKRTRIKEEAQNSLNPDSYDFFLSEFFSRDASLGQLEDQIYILQQEEELQMAENKKSKKKESKASKLEALANLPEAKMQEIEAKMAAYQESGDTTPRKERKDLKNKLKALSQFDNSSEYDVDISKLRKRLQKAELRRQLYDQQRLSDEDMNASLKDLQEKVNRKSNPTQVVQQAEELKNTVSDVNLALDNYLTAKERQKYIEGILDNSTDYSRNDLTLLTDAEIIQIYDTITSEPPPDVVIPPEAPDVPEVPQEVKVRVSREQMIDAIVEARKGKLLGDNSDDLSTPEIEAIYNDLVQRGKIKVGSGKEDEKGITNTQIDNALKDNPEYKGCCTLDEFPSIIHKFSPNQPGYCVILINYNPKDASLSGHWVALRVDSCDDYSIEYYDPLADPIPEKLQSYLVKLVAHLNPKIYLKLKTNNIKQQAENTSNCGYFSIRFILDRMRGKPFPEASGYSEVRKNERQIREFKEKFPYISGTGMIEKSNNTVFPVVGKETVPLRGGVGIETPADLQRRLLREELARRRANSNMFQNIQNQIANFNTPEAIARRAREELARRARQEALNRIRPQEGAQPPPRPEGSN